MYSDYRLQIDQILEDTEKEEANNSQDKIAAVAMYKIMVGAIGKFIEKESYSDPEFDAALSLDWKNAGRMLKYIWSKAEKMALRHGQTASCCLTEEAVYAWVREYYFLDDREMVMEERAKKAEAGRKRKQRAVEAAKEAWYRENAIDLLSKQSGWTDLPDEEKNKKIASKIKSLRKKDNDKPAKSTTKTTACKSARDKDDASETTGRPDTVADESQNGNPEMHFTENSIEQEMAFANTLDGQINLFNLI